MLINSSSTFNDSDPHQHLPSISTFYQYILCYSTKPSSIIFITYNIFAIFFHLPVSGFILKHGLQQWQKKRAGSSASISHADWFTYNLVFMELIGVIGCFLNCFGVYKEDMMGTLKAGVMIVTFTWFGETFFHLSTCLERYLAVIYPITYVSLRNERGIRTRNIIIGCTWLLSIIGLVSSQYKFFNVINFFVLISSGFVISYCSFSVLCVLIRPGPGKQHREKFGQSKQRAFFTIMVILGTLLLRFSWSLFFGILYTSEKYTDCVIMTIDVWFNMPSTMVLPLLFLHRTGMCWKNRN